MPEKITFDKEKYRELCSGRNDIPIFFQPWWLDAACEGGVWNVMLYTEDPDVVAIYTFFLKKKGVVRYITMPALTKFCGPFFLKKVSSRKERRIVGQLEAALPKTTGFQQTFHYQITNWLPFFWENYRQVVYYSFLLQDIQALDQTFENMATDYRNNKIGRAQKVVAIKSGLSREKFFHLIEAPFIRQDIKLPVAKEVIFNLLKTCEQQGRGKSFYAEDVDGNIYAAIYLIWDGTSCYLLFAGEDPEYRSTGAGVYLTWKGIEFASLELNCKEFDFLGGMSYGLERTRRQFGAEAVPYFYIRKWEGIMGIFDQLHGNS